MAFVICCFSSHSLSSLRVCVAHSSPVQIPLSARLSCEQDPTIDCLSNRLSCFLQLLTNANKLWHLSTSFSDVLNYFVVHKGHSHRAMNQMHISSWWRHGNTKSKLPVLSECASLSSVSLSLICFMCTILWLDNRIHQDSLVLKAGCAVWWQWKKGLCHKILRLSLPSHMDLNNNIYAIFLSGKIPQFRVLNMVERILIYFFFWESRTDSCGRLHSTWLHWELSHITKLLHKPLLLEIWCFTDTKTKVQ